MTISRGVQKIERRIIEVPDFKSFAVIGDPGCDGLGAEIMQIFAELLAMASTGDFTLVLGDVVPSGAKPFYQSVKALMNSLAQNPLFVLRGNHDTNFYDGSFGFADYAIADSRTLLVALDDSERKISTASAAFLRETLEQHARANIVLAMHIPPPNRVSENAISAGEWKKLVHILAPHKEKFKYILCGHVHSYFEDTIDGARLIASGGGGARIEDVEGVSAPYYHLVRFFYDEGGTLCFQREELVGGMNDVRNEPDGGSGPGASFSASAEMRGLPAASFTGECMAHVRYRLYAEKADRQGFPHLAKLFRAAAESEFYHARNFFYTSESIKELSEAVAESITNERHEVEKLYRGGLDRAQAVGAGLAAYAFTDALEAEKIHQGLFEKALSAITAGRDIPESNYWTCGSCGYTFSSACHPGICPVCGAPFDKITEVA
ncbi:MAG: metallophosphoesterase [Treponema sp.]|jgi:rubrerythrin|nr:metallophosphoesterase [Treponema sp.]